MRVSVFTANCDRTINNEVGISKVDRLYRNLPPAIASQAGLLPKSLLFKAF